MAETPEDNTDQQILAGDTSFPLLPNVLLCVV